MCDVLLDNIFIRFTGYMHGFKGEYERLYYFAINSL